MNVKKLKLLSFICAAVMVIGVVATGCSNSSTSNNNSSTAVSTDVSTAASQPETQAEAPKPGDKDATLRFAWWGGDARHEATFEALKIFNAKYPKVKVEVEYQGYDGYHDKMFTQLASGTAPDLFQYNPENLPDIVGENKIESLDSYIKNGLLDLSNVADASLYDGKYDGKIYGIPMSTQTFCVMYNKNLFDEAKVVYPEDTWTWEDYDRIVKELQKDSQRVSMRQTILDRLISQPF